MSTLLKTHRSPSILFQQDYYPKVQPRSSAERDNNLLLLTALKAASTDMAHRLLDYASLDRADCEASCILIALANHDINMDDHNQSKEHEEQKVENKEKPANNNNTSPEITENITNDPIMLLVAAAEVVDKSDYQPSNVVTRKRYPNYPHEIRLNVNIRPSEEDEHRRDAYPNGRYYRKSDDLTTKRLRTTPPTPAPTHRQDAQREISHYDDNYKNDHCNTKEHGYNTNYMNPYHSKNHSSLNAFTHQYHTMKQNPKVKQNALHAYITYMIYNDIAHGQKQHSNSYDDNTSSNYTPTMSHNSNSIPYHKQPYQDKINHRSNTINNHPYQQQRPEYTQYAGDASMHNDINVRPRSSLKDNSPIITNHSPLTTKSMSIKQPSTNSTEMTPWYSTPATTPPTSSRTPQPPSIINDDRSIISRPLTAFLWNDNPTASSTSSDRKDAMILPPLLSRPPSVNNYDRLPPV
ncbi:hypothetical protein BDB01DRAFT_854173 [Pilobolus umbonatus]|nr:hypothetical protein BDB01DRAFT_854173 [Pilobolus umbonatus]